MSKKLSKCSQWPRMGSYRSFNVMISELSVLRSPEEPTKNTHRRAGVLANLGCVVRQSQKTDNNNKNSQSIVEFREWPELPSKTVFQDKELNTSIK